MSQAASKVQCQSPRPLPKRACLLLLAVQIASDPGFLLQADLDVDVGFDFGHWTLAVVWTLDDFLIRPTRLRQPSPGGEWLGNIAVLFTDSADIW